MSLKNHIDEHTLELLALCDPDVRKIEKRIRRHLDGCGGCRKLFDEIKTYYAEVERESKLRLSAAPSMAQRSLVRRRNELETYFAPVSGEAISYEEIKRTSLMRRLSNFGRRHPVSSVSSALFLAVILYFSWVHYFLGNSKAAYYCYNIPSHRIEVYNSEDKLLWFKNASGLENINSVYTLANAAPTVLADLGGNGENDLLTTLGLASQPGIAMLREFGTGGKLVNQFAFPPMRVVFRGTAYDAPFGSMALLKLKMPDSSINIFMSASNGRSPTILARLNRNLHVVGEYWHFGNFLPYVLPPSQGGKALVAVAGSDDVDDISGNRRAFLAVLDPQKLVGTSECSATRGFGYPASEAEEYYIRFPEIELEKILGVNVGVMVEGDINDSVMYVGLKSSYNMNVTNSFGFDFVVNRKDMSIREVKYISNTETVYAELKREGKINRTLNKEYLEKLKSGVRYWNGTEWVKHPSRIFEQAAGVR